MKLLVIFFIVLTSNCYAQEEHYSLNAHLGYGLSDLLNNGGYTNIKPTFNAGIEVRRRLGQKGVFIQTGLRWNGYGYRYTGLLYVSNDEHNGMITVNEKSTSFFLTLPIIATYKFKKSLTGLTFSAGPQLSFYLFSKSVNAINTSFHRWDYDLVNLGIHTSIGYEYNMGKNWILGTEFFSNLIYPTKWYINSPYNFGFGLSGRYILSTISS